MYIYINIYYYYNIVITPSVVTPQRAMHEAEVQSNLAHISGHICVLIIAYVVNIVDIMDCSHVQISRRLKIDVSNMQITNEFLTDFSIYMNS